MSAPARGRDAIDSVIVPGAALTVISAFHSNVEAAPLFRASMSGC
jgi:hypothetical protein